MRKLFCITILMIGVVLTAISQKKDVLVFFNDSTNKAVQLRVNGSMAVIEYQGYLDQEELASNYLLQLNDSSLVLGKPRVFANPVELHTIRLDDITGFRKVSTGSQFLKVAITLGVTLGTYFAISNNDNFNSTEQLIYSSAAALGTSYGLKLAFPVNRVKHKIKDGWRIIVM